MLKFRCTQIQRRTHDNSLEVTFRSGDPALFPAAMMVIYTKEPNAFALDCEYTADKIAEWGGLNAQPAVRHA